MNLRTLTIAAALMAAPALTYAQQPTDIAPTAQTGQAAQTSFSKEQLLTATVHQAWLMSNKDEATFFSMVEQCAAISATNRGLTLPDSAAAGRRMGDYIKRTAKADTDQLLYAVVDKAVVMITHAPAHPAASAKPKS